MPSLTKSQTSNSCENILNSIDEDNEITLGENIITELAKTVQLKWRTNFTSEKIKEKSNCLPQEIVQI